MGQALADVAIEGSDRHAIGRLNELHLSTQIEQLDAEIALGRHARVVGELESLTAANPYQERLAAQLMLALYRSGRQADALEFYRALRRRSGRRARTSAEPGAPRSRASDPAPGQRASRRRPWPSLRRWRVRAREPDGPGTPPRALRRKRGLLLGAATLATLAIGGAFAAILVEDDPPLVVAPPQLVAAVDPATTMSWRVFRRRPPRPRRLRRGAIWVETSKTGR